MKRSAVVAEPRAQELNRTRGRAVSSTFMKLHHDRTCLRPPSTSTSVCWCLLTVLVSQGHQVGQQVMTLEHHSCRMCVDTQQSQG